MLVSLLRNKNVFLFHRFWITWCDCPKSRKGGKGLSEHNGEWVTGLVWTKLWHIQFMWVTKYGNRPYHKPWIFSMQKWKDKVKIIHRDGSMVTQGSFNHLMAQNDRLKEFNAEMAAELQVVEELIDDILYDPKFKPIDINGNRITGDDLYLMENEIQYQHLPALREWFVGRCT